jgi:hypothetical protein
MMHVKHLCQMSRVKKGDTSSLRQLINHVSSHMNALQTLSLNVPTHDLVLNHLMLATPNCETQREWELITASRADTPTIAELVTFLKSRCRAFELLQTTQSLKTTTVPSRSSQSAGSKVSKPAYSNAATQLQCPLCNESHRLLTVTNLSHCKLSNASFMPKKIGLCFNCLQPFTKNHTCSKQMCRQCHRKYTFTY